MRVLTQFSQIRGTLSMRTNPTPDEKIPLFLVRHKVLCLRRNAQTILHNLDADRVLPYLRFRIYRWDKATNILEPEH